MAHLGAAGQGDAAAGRGPHGHDRLRRDPLPGAARAVPGPGDRAGRGRVRGGPGDRARVPAAGQLGGRGPGRQPDRDRAGDQGNRGDPRGPCAARAGDRGGPDRPVADPQLPRAAGARPGRRAAHRGPAAPGPAGRDNGTGAPGAVPLLSAVRGAAAAGHPAGRRHAGVPRARRVRGRRGAAAGRAGRRGCAPAGVR